MKRIRLSTLLLLIVIAAMGMALVVQSRRIAEQERTFEGMAAKAEAMKEHYRYMIMQSEKESPFVRHPPRRALSRWDNKRLTSW